MLSVTDHYINGEKLYNKMILPVCEKHGLTFMEFTVIMFLANNPQYDTATNIVEYRHLTKSHVSISIHSLEEKGLLKGFYKNENRRTVHLQLLDKSEKIIEDGRKAQLEFKNIITEGFSEEDKNTLSILNERIDNNIKRHLQERGTV